MTTKTDTVSLVLITEYYSSYNFPLHLKPADNIPAFFNFSYTSSVKDNHEYPL